MSNKLCLIWPDSVKDNIPRHALEIYKVAFNSALKKILMTVTMMLHKKIGLHRVAWSEVKKMYEKRDGKWTRKSRD